MPLQSNSLFAIDFFCSVMRARPPERLAPFAKKHNQKE
jgi:hypothetical protein